MKCGCNYWASNAGTEMWKNWDETVVRKDFERMRECGLTVVRVFPRWPDFQPIELLRKYSNLPREIRMHGNVLPDTPCGRAGIDETMVKKFRTLAEIAKENRITLIVGLLTGWMSGELFMPPALQGLNPFTDPMALKWESRYIQTLVRELKDCSAIELWEIGNECNCMEQAESREVAWNWTNVIVSAIRSGDPSRPVSSGMHSLIPGADTEFESETMWTIQTQGELCDFLTSHPYPHSPSKLPARVDSHLSLRAAFQATVETRLYGDIGKKPAFVEEIGTFTPGYCNETTKALFLRNTLYNSWAHDSGYFLWWCGFEQSMLRFPPYDWSTWERELGLYDADFKRRPIAEEIQKFSNFQQQLPCGELPPFRRDAVCLLTRNLGFNGFLENGWSAFLLAKQAGFDIQFQFISPNPPESSCYVIPGIRGSNWSTGSEYLAILEKVKAGATLYLSLEDGTPCPLESVFGCEIVTREARRTPAKVVLNGTAFEVSSPFKLFVKPLDCEVLAAETDGNPVMIRHAYGKGEVVLMTIPLERYLGSVPGAFEAGASDWAAFYRSFSKRLVDARRLRSTNTLLTLTEHEDAKSGRVWAVAVNNSNAPMNPALQFSAGWSTKEPLPAKIEAHGGLLMELVQTGK